VTGHLIWYLRKTAAALISRFDESPWSRLAPLPLIIPVSGVD